MCLPYKVPCPHGTTEKCGIKIQRPAVETRVAVALDCLVGRSPQDECGEGTCKLEHRRLYCTLPDILENAAYDAESYIDRGS
jgi:hypothetical protein